MLLVIDIGNTNISMGLFKRELLWRSWVIPTRRKNYCRYLRKPLAPYKNLIEDTIICSVVPNALTYLLGDLKRFLAKKPKVLGKDIVVPIKNCYKKPSQVGQDRLVGAYAAVMLYGYPAIVVDFGTAITLDVISKKAEYLGGLILPGLELSCRALSEKTAKLPYVNPVRSKTPGATALPTAGTSNGVKLTQAKGFIGRDTRASILKGVAYGFSFMVGGLITNLKKQFRIKKVIATGGDLEFIKKSSSQIQIFEPNLCLRGLYLIYEKGGA